MANYQHIKGFEQMARQLQALPGKIFKTHLRKTTLAGARVIRQEARARAPVRTGDMRRNIIIKYAPENSKAGVRACYLVLVRKGKLKTKAHVNYVYKNKKTVAGRISFYWYYLEFGTVKMQARPFMRPAFSNKKDAAVDAMAEAFGSITIDPRV